jgi:hypothetical protein
VSLPLLSLSLPFPFLARVPTLPPTPRASVVSLARGVAPLTPHYAAPQPRGVASPAPSGAAPGPQRRGLPGPVVGLFGPRGVAFQAPRARPPGPCARSSWPRCAAPTLDSVAPRRAAPGPQQLSPSRLAKRVPTCAALARPAIKFQFN